MVDRLNELCAFLRRFLAWDSLVSESTGAASLLEYRCASGTLI